MFPTCVFYILTGMKYLIIVGSPGTTEISAGSPERRILFLLAEKWELIDIQHDKYEGRYWLTLMMLVIPLTARLRLRARLERWPDQPSACPSCPPTGGSHRRPQSSSESSDHSSSHPSSQVCWLRNRPCGDGLKELVLFCGIDTSHISFTYIVMCKTR